MSSRNRTWCCVKEVLCSGPWPFIKNGRVDDISESVGGSRWDEVLLLVGDTSLYSSDVCWLKPLGPWLLAWDALASTDGYTCMLDVSNSSSSDRVSMRRVVLLFLRAPPVARTDEVCPGVGRSVRQT